MATPPVAPPPPRVRRRWAVPVAAVAVAAVLGLVAGLVIWAPWQSPPLPRPAGLMAGPSTTTSVAFRWAGPATGPPPDRYVILHDGKVIGSVSGTVTSYRGAGLAPATAYQFRVAAVRGGKRSALSSVLVVRTATPPVSAARLQGPWTVRVKVVRGASTLIGLGKHDSWYESWLARPKCAAGPCAVRLSGHIFRFRFRTTLTRSGAVYRGKVTGKVFPCGSGSGSFPTRSTMMIRITVETAQPDSRAWAAGSWAGTMRVVSPYAASGNFYCPAARQTLSLHGRP